MKKQITKAAAMGMAAAMAATLLAGCGGAASSTAASSTASSAATSTDAASAEAGSYTDYTAGFPEKVTIQIPVYDRGFEGWDVTNNYYTQYVQKEFGDKYNINVEYVSVGRSTEVQDYMQMIAAHTAPDIIMHYDMPQAVNYYSEGAMQDVDYDEIAFYAPSYWASMQSTVETYGKLDGKNAFIFAERDPIYYNFVRLIRQDWLDQVGAEMPTTWEELQAVLAKWKEAGLGTMSEQLITKSFTYEYGFIDAATTDDEKALYLDLNVAPFTWSATENYLKARNTQYNAGLLDSEFYLNTEEPQYKAKFVAGQSGIYALYMSSGTDVISSLLANDPEAKLAVMPASALASADSHQYYYQYPPYGMIMGINADTSAEERAAVYMYLDWMIQPENLFFMQHGIEGETYTLDADGIALQNADYTGEAKLSQNNNKDYWCLVQEIANYGDEAKDLTSNKVTLAPAGYEDLIQQAYDYDKLDQQYGIITPIFTKAIESSSEYAADLNALWQEAYVDCVTCAPEEFDAKYAEYKQEYLDAGYQEILDEKQSLIDSGDVLQIK
ncbi:MAG: extracellular solute-binding protein [Gemmiger sp.]|nr:extracellular solute-binding protein [Gemmiger sp.]